MMTQENYSNIGLSWKQDKLSHTTDRPLFHFAQCFIKLAVKMVIFVAADNVAANKETGLLVQQNCAAAQVCILLYIICFYGACTLPLR